MPNKSSMFEFNYELKYSMQNRKPEQDMWNVCWTDNVLAVDFCREMRRFQKINVSWRLCGGGWNIFNLNFHSISLGCLRSVGRICWHETWTECWSSSPTTIRSFPKLGAFQLSNLLIPPLQTPFLHSFTHSLGDAIQYSRQHKNKTFIIKPDQGSQGRGIWLTKNLKEVKINERMICQVYLNKPLLIDGFKFDLRVYALVTSTDPLRIFVYNEGLAR